MHLPFWPSLLAPPQPLSLHPLPQEMRSSSRPCSLLYVEEPITVELPRVYRFYLRSIKIDYIVPRRNIAITIPVFWWSYPHFPLAPPPPSASSLSRASMTTPITMHTAHSPIITHSLSPTRALPQLHTSYPPIELHKHFACTSD